MRLGRRAARQQHEVPVGLRQHGEQRLDPAAGVEEGGGGPLPRRKPRDVVAHHSVEERHAIRARQLEHAPARAVHHPDRRPHGPVLGARITVRHREVRAARRVEHGARSQLELAEG